MAGITTVAAVVITLLGAITVAIFLAVAFSTVLVTRAVRIEKRHGSLIGPAPGPGTRMARRILSMPLTGPVTPKPVARAPHPATARTTDTRQDRWPIATDGLGASRRQAEPSAVTDHRTLVG